MDFDEISHCMVFHLGLHYLAKYSIHLGVTSSQRVKDPVFIPQLELFSNKCDIS